MEHYFVVIDCTDLHTQIVLLPGTVLVFQIYLFGIRHKCSVNKYCNICLIKTLCVVV